MSQLSVQKRLTTAFIARNPVTLILTPHVKVGDGTGGSQMALGTARDPQVVTLVEPSDSGYRAPAVAAQGSENAIDFLLVGPFDMAIAEDDTFELDGFKYRIVTVMPFNGYEMRAMVSRYA